MARSPLIEYLDPVGILQQQALSGRLRGRERGDDRPLTISDLLEPEEEKSLLEQAAEGAGTGLGAAAYVLDSPGSLVRGLLAGQPLSALGTSQERVSGRDLLREYDMIGDEDNWGNFLGGLAVEIVTDPLTYINPFAALGKGALTKTVGKPLQKAGVLSGDIGVTARKSFRPEEIAAASSQLDEALGVLSPSTSRELAEVVPEVIPPSTDPDIFKTFTAQAQEMPVRSEMGAREYLQKLDPRRGFVEAIADQKLQGQREIQEALQRFAAAGGDFDGQGAAGLMNFQVPFFQGTQEALGIKDMLTKDITGGEFYANLARGLDQFGLAAKRAPYLGKAITGTARLFNPSVGKSLDEGNQLIARDQFQKAMRNEQRANRSLSRLEMLANRAEIPSQIEVPGFGLREVPQELVEEGFNSQRMQNALRDILENSEIQRGTASPSLGGINITDRSGAETLLGQTGMTVPDPTERQFIEALLGSTEDLRELRDIYANLPDFIRGGMQQRGVDTGSWQSGLADYFPRRLREFAGEETLNVGDQFTRVDGTVDTITQEMVDAQTPIVRQGYGANREKLFDLQDNFGRRRREFTDVPGAAETFRKLTAGPEARELQADLLRADQDQSRYLIDSFFERNVGPLPYEGKANADRLTDQLSNFLRGLDRRYADEGIGVFDNPLLQDAGRYARGQARVAAHADVAFDQLAKSADNLPAASHVGNTHMSVAEAATQLGFDPELFANRWIGQSNLTDPNAMSVSRDLVAALTELQPISRLDNPTSDLMRGADSFQNAWKAGALAWPSFHARNLLSNAIGTMSLGFSPNLKAGYAASRGDFGPMAQVLENAPGYRGLDPEQRMNKFIEDSAEMGIGRTVSRQTTADLGMDVANKIDSVIPGASPDETILAEVKKMYQPGRSWRQFGKDLITLRGVGLNRVPEETMNPLLRVNEAVGRTVEDMTRLGQFGDAISRGYSPQEAGRLVNTALVDYTPQAFTDFERNVMKRAMPFYSFQKGIMPLVKENLLYTPGGLMGQSVRAIDRGAEMNEERFIPEYMRKSASIQLPDFLAAEDSTPFLTNIEAGPWLSTLGGIFQPGVGDTLLEKAGSSLGGTLQNIGGMLNPMLKAPVEMMTGKQLYSGRNLSDLYSAFEEEGVPGGRTLENLIMNFAPGGSRGLGVFKTLTDDRSDMNRRLAKLAINNLLGVKLTDRDMARERERQIRNFTEQRLRQNPNVTGFENLYVRDEDLAKLTPEQMQAYLLYRKMAVEAQQRARERKKAKELLNQ